MIVSPLILSLVLAADAEPAPKLPLGKDTTYVTGPLDKDGYIDYEAALNERLGKGVTPETNAAVLLWKAVGPTPEGGKRMPAGFFKRLGMEEPPKDGTYFIGLREFVKDTIKLDPREFDAIYDQQSQAGRRPWSAKDYPHITAWLEANEKPLALVVEATRRPDYYNPLVAPRTGKGPEPLLGASLSGVQQCRELAMALAARAMLRLGEGKCDDAWQDLIACHRLGRLVGRGGMLIEALAAMAIDQIASNADLAYLERADLNVKQLQGCLKDLHDLPPMPPPSDKVDLAERFMYLDSVELVRRGGVDGLADKDGEKSLAAIDWKPALRDGNRLYDRLAAAMRLKDRAEREKEFDQIEQDLKAAKKRANGYGGVAKILLGGQPDKVIGEAMSDTLISLLAPAVSRVQNAYDRDEQVQRNVQVAFALAAYRRDHGGYPAALGDLAPRYLPAVPDDLFSGAALVYHPSDTGYQLYSVGPNGQDDGGHTFDDDPPGDDLVVVMPLPELKTKK